MRTGEMSERKKDLVNSPLYLNMGGRSKERHFQSFHDMSFHDNGKPNVRGAAIQILL